MSLLSRLSRMPFDFIRFDLYRISKSYPNKLLPSKFFLANSNTTIASFNRSYSSMTLTFYQNILKKCNRSLLFILELFQGLWLVILLQKKNVSEE